jgi:O-antigen chain-terminating methyltransferase
VYVPLFAGAADVLDVGCGRGEFLSLLRDAGIRARGIDLNDAMVDVCRERGLDAVAADALTYLRRQPDASLGGLFAAQVVEHLQPGYLTQLLDAACEKLRPGAAIVLETINPACWFAFFESYVRDITHERPLHPETLQFLLVASGFHAVEIRYSAPYPEHEKLQPVAGIPIDAAETLNANVEKVNRLLFTYLDYAAIARR